MRVLLSIRPEFATQILAGTKKYEYRRTIFRQGGVRKVLIYASHPVCRVVGEFEIEGILEGSPGRLWSRTGKFGGITKERFFEYFSNAETAYAIEIRKPTKYCTPLVLQKHLGVTPPQSFVYV
jgi:predicted transcriptional regulator